MCNRDRITIVLLVGALVAAMSSPGLAQLYVENVNTSPSSSPLHPGDSINVSYEVDYSGLFPPPGPYAVGIYLNTSPNFSGATLIGTDSASGTGNHFVSVQIPATGLSPRNGNFYCGVRLLSGGAGDYSPVLYTIHTQPELVAQSINPPPGGVADQGASVTVAYSTANQGAPTTPPGYGCEIRLSTDQVITTADTLLSSFTTSSGPGMTTVQIPPSTPPGTYHLGLLIPVPAEGDFVPGNNTVASAAFSVVIPSPIVGSVNPSSGSFFGGETVSILGQHLSGASAVLFDGVPATNLIVVSDGELQCTTPPAPGNVTGPADVGVTAPGGTTVLAGAFSYDSPYPGTDEDLRLSAALNAFPIPGDSPAIIAGTGGDVLRVFIDSPGATQDFNFLAFLGNAFPTGNGPPSPFGFPYVYFDPSDPLFIVILDPVMPNPFFGPTLLFPGGNHLQFILPTNAAGYSATFQAITLDSGSANSWFVASDAFELQLL